MPADLERLLREAAASPVRGVDPDRLLVMARRRRVRRRGGGVALALALTLLAGLGLPRLTGGTLDFAFGGSIAVLPLPPEGAVAAEFLPDGTPVFVAHEAGGEVHVVRAAARYGVADLGVVWCAPGRRFMAEWNASQFTVDGTWAGGPSPHGLVTYELEVQDQQVRLLRLREPAPRAKVQPRLGGTIQECWGREVLDRSGVVDHGWLERSAVFTPEEALRLGSPEPVLVRAILVEYADGHAALCAQLARTQPAACPEGELPLERERQPDTDTWAMDVLALGVVRDGRFTDVLLPVVFGGVDVHDSDPPAPPSPPAGFGPEDRMVLAGWSLVVPTRDIAYGTPPDELRAGQYHLRLENHGGIVHTLVHEGGELRLRAESYRADEGVVDLTPGEHVFYCELPGHRSAGMVFTLRVR